MENKAQYVIFDSPASIPFGHIVSAAENYKSKGVPRDHLRTLNAYAIVYITQGEGFYYDAVNGEIAVKAGSLLLIFPDVPHAYGPSNHGVWEESHIIFKGPAIDLWYQNGVIKSEEPILFLDAIEYWYKKINDIAFSVGNTNLIGALARLSKLQLLLTEMLAFKERQKIGTANNRWLVDAKALLEKDLIKKINLEKVALELNMTYDGFRKAFTRIEGVSPGRYRSHCVIQLAGIRLATQRLTIREIAYELGFSSEFHLSKRFKQITGMTPGQYRKTLPGTIT